MPAKKKAAPKAKQAEGMTIHSIQRYGWIPDLPDARDHQFSAPMEVLGTLPPSADLRPLFQPPYDQGQLGSCTGNAIAGTVQFDRRKQGTSEASTNDTWPLAMIRKVFSRRVASA